MGASMVRSEDDVTAAVEQPRRPRRRQPAPLPRAPPARPRRRRQPAPPPPEEEEEEEEPAPPAPTTARTTPDWWPRRQADSDTEEAPPPPPAMDRDDLLAFLEDLAGEGVRLLTTERGTLAGGGIYLGSKHFSLGMKILANTVYTFPTQLPPWQPSSIGQVYANWLCVKTIHADPGYTDTGVGRLVINMLQQIETTRVPTHEDTPPTGILISLCHFPIFYTTDSQYHWTVVPHRIEADGGGTEAGPAPYRLFPMYWPITEKKGSAEYERKTKENAAADLAYNDLTWLPPIVWAERRAAEVLGQEAGRRSAVKCLKYLQIALGATLEDSRRRRALTWTNRKPTWLQRFSVDTACLSTSLALDAAAVARVQQVARSCRLMGNNDTFLWDFFKGPARERLVEAVLAPDMTDVRAFFLGADAFAFAADVSEKRRLALASVILAYLVDYARVVYRPIFLDSALVMWLAPDADPVDGAYPLGDSAEAARAYTWPLPYFSFEAELGEGGLWMWLPQKKPHSTYWGGRAVLPLPFAETPPRAADYEKKGGERVAKRGRLIEARSCFECAATGGDLLHDGVFTFCNPACQLQYYTQ